MTLTKLLKHGSPLKNDRLIKKRKMLLKNGMGIKKWRNNGVISGVNKEELEAKEKIILSKIEGNPNLSTRELNETLDIPFRSVQRYISNLREKGFIKRIRTEKMVIGKL